MPQLLSNNEEVDQKIKSSLLIVPIFCSLKAIFNDAFSLNPAIITAGFSGWYLSRLSKITIK